MTRLAKLVATALGAGYSPVAPGTCGTAVAVPLAWSLATLPWWGFVMITAAVTILGIWAAGEADRAWGTHDSGRIVIDEVAGLLVTVTFVDRSRWVVLAVGFVVFRAFDIIKPPPIRWVDEKMPGGAGVVLDDVAAGVMGAAVMIGLDHAGAFDALARALA
ncbi:MAG: phosphatidylglycerophosphatase A [Kofleriaceae bacterium]|nr:phosphatidylglycerophosphatase A [Myxococcales bacterium]MCB9570690.1 phosphatidylglycerophosphatase A [Kofleriaceae bacterium]